MNNWGLETREIVNQPGLRDFLTPELNLELLLTCIQAVSLLFHGQKKLEGLDQDCISSILFAH